MGEGFGRGYWPNGRPEDFRSLTASFSRAGVLDLHLEPEDESII